MSAAIKEGRMGSFFTRASLPGIQNAAKVTTVTR